MRMPKDLLTLCIALFPVFVSMAAFTEEIFHNRETSERVMDQKKMQLIGTAEKNGEEAQKPKM